MSISKALFYQLRLLPRSVTVPCLVSAAAGSSLRLCFWAAAHYSEDSSYLPVASTASPLVNFLVPKRRWPIDPRAY